MIHLRSSDHLGAINIVFAQNTGGKKIGDPQGKL